MSTSVYQNLSAEKKEKILKAIEQEFILKDFSNIKVTDICQRAEIPRSAFYRYFDSLEDAIKTFFIASKDKMEVHFKNIEASQDGDLYNIAVQVFETCLDDENALAVMFKQMKLATDNPYFRFDEEDPKGFTGPTNFKIIGLVAISLVQLFMGKKLTKEEAIDNFKECVAYLKKI